MIYLIVVVVILLYIFLKRKHFYWVLRDVPGPKPIFLIGSFLSLIDKRRHNQTEVSKLYKEFKGKTSVIGVYNGLNPALLIIDPKLAKQIMVNDFSHFTDTVENLTINKEVDPIIGLNPFFLKGDEWKEKRGEISPVFSNSRIKSLFPVMQETSQQMINYLLKQLQDKEHLEMHEICAKYATNVVASSVFGIDGEAFTNENSDIRNITKKMLTPSFRLVYVLFIAPFFPKIAKLLNVKLCQEKEETLLKRLFKEAVEYRQQSKIERHDFLKFLIELRDKKGLSETKIAAHTLSFFWDGVETSSLTLSNIFYELAKNQECQIKLRNELLKIKDEKGHFDYDSLKDNEYLEQVIYESLRLHPIMHVHYRNCTDEVEIEINKETHKHLKIAQGTRVMLAVYDFARDHEYFGPDADIFNPDRFAEENGGIKHFMEKGVLFPFGDGPRICLGQRLAKAQLKCCIANLITSFNFTVSKEMPKTPTYDQMNFLLTYKSGVLLNLEPIK